MINSEQLQHDLDQAKADQISDSTTTAYRQVGLRFVIESSSDQSFEDVQHTFNRIHHQFEVESLFPEPDFETRSDDNRASALDQHGYVAALPGLCYRDLSLNLFDVAEDIRNLGGFVRTVPDMPLEAETKLVGPTHEEADITDAASDSRVWALKAMKVKEAWEAMLPIKPGQGVRIGHPDTGYTSHVEWQAGGLDLTDQANFVERDAPKDARDRMTGGALNQPGHGTHTAAVMVAPGGIKEDYSDTTTPGRVTGVATAAVHVPLRTVTSVIIPPGFTEVARAIKWCIEKKLPIISLSLGGVPLTLHPDIWWAAIDATKKNHIIIAAAGNYPSEIPEAARFVVDPAGWDFVIGVTASTKEDKPWAFSGRRTVWPLPYPQISAPGHEVFTASGHNANKWSTSSGTSYATAHIAGVAATWLSKHFPNGYRGGREAAHVFKDHLKSTARKPAGWDDRFGPGIVDLHALVTSRPPMSKSDAEETSADYSHIESFARRLLAQSNHQVMTMFNQTLFPSLQNANKIDIEKALSVWAPEIHAILSQNPTIMGAMAQQLRDFPVDTDSSVSVIATQSAKTLRSLVSEKASRSMINALTL